MKISFNDEKLADDDAMQNMNANYNKVKAQTFNKVRAMQTETEPNLTELANNIRQSGQYLEFLQRFDMNGDVRNFVNQLQNLNDNELAELTEFYTSLSDFAKQNPNFPECLPRNFQQINRRFLQSELTVIEELFNAYELETRQEVKDVISRIIKRRLQALQMLLVQNRNCLRNIWQYF